MFILMIKNLLLSETSGYGDSNGMSDTNAIAASTVGAVIGITISISITGVYIAFKGVLVIVGNHSTFFRYTLYVH